MEEASSTSSSALPDSRKLFIGGIPRNTTEQILRSYFEKYGEVVYIYIPFDRINERHRGFGFVHFDDPAVGQRVLEVKEHIINGRKVEVKMATPQSKHQSPNQMQPRNQGDDRCYNNCTNGHSCVGKKIFVGGLPSTLTEDEFRSYFETFGQITDVVIIRENITNRPRGFGFITYESEDSVKDVLRQSDHQHGRHLHSVGGKNVEVKIASPKANNRHNQHSVVDQEVPFDYHQVETIQYYPRYNGYMSPGVSIYPYGGANYYGGHMNMNGFYSGYASPSATWNLQPFGGMRYYTDVHIFQGGQIPFDGHIEVAEFDDNSPVDDEI